MTDSKEFQDLRKKLDSLREREYNIKLERGKILANQPWYSRPQNVIAVLAILIPIIFSILFKLYDEEKKELTVYYSEPQKLLTSSEQLKGSLLLTYDSLSIQNISSVSIRIQNSGDLSVKKQDFIDGPIKFQIRDKKFSNSESIQTIVLEIIKLSDANQQNSKIDIIETDGIGEFYYLPSLLNSGDEVLLKVLVSNEPSLDITVVGKIENGKIKTSLYEEKQTSTLNLNKWSEYLIKLFKNRAISIPLTIGAFFVLLIFNILTWNLHSEKEFESDPKFIGVLLLLGFSLFSIFSLAFFITLII